MQSFVGDAANHARSVVDKPTRTVVQAADIIYEWTGKTRKSSGTLTSVCVNESESEAFVSRADGYIKILSFETTAFHFYFSLFTFTFIDSNGLIEPPVNFFVLRFRR